MQLWTTLGLSFSTAKKAISFSLKQQLYSDLHLLLSSGLDLRYATQLLVEDCKNAKLKLKLEGVQKSIIQGNGLSKSLQNQLNISEFEFYSLKIGEESGTIVEVLGQLAEYFETQINQRRQLISALSYPVVVLCTAIGAVVFMLQVVVPLFMDVFERFGKELPDLTKMVITSSDLIGEFLGPVILFVVLFMLCLPLLRKKSWFKSNSSKLIIKIPVFGKIVLKSYLLRWVSGMELMLRTNTNLVDAIKLSKKMVDYYPISSALSSVEQELIEGNSLYQAMAKHHVFENRTITLIRAGEEVNKLPDSFKQIKIQLKNQIDHFTSTVGKILEPAIVVFIGIFVGGIIIAMYLPMFELSTLI